MFQVDFVLKNIKITLHKFLECLLILFFAFMIFRQKQDVPERVSPPPLERLLIIRNTGGLAASASVPAG